MDIFTICRPSLCLALLLAFASLARAAEPSSLFPAKVKRVVFLGDSITYAGQYVEDISAYQRTRFPDAPVEIINVGLPSETVSGLSEPGHAGGKFPRPDLHERLARVLAKTKPDLVLACYGMNDGIYMPLDEVRFKAYQDGINWLHAQVMQAGADVIHLTPPVFDEVKGGHAGYDQVLTIYADWLMSQRTNGWQVINLHAPMRSYLNHRRAWDATYSLAKDGVHPGEFGHWLMAQTILEQLGVPEAERADSIGKLLATFPRGHDILDQEQANQRQWKDAWLTAIGHKRPGMNRGAPMEINPQTGAARLLTN